MINDVIEHFFKCLNKSEISKKNKIFNYKLQ
jgi:hypothetical protein